MKFLLSRGCRLLIAVGISLHLIGWSPCEVLAQLQILDPGQGRVLLSSGGTGAAELSGLAHRNGTNYVAVGDNGATSIWELTISVEASSGTISSSGVTGGISVPGLGADSEGIAFRAATGSVFVSDEVASNIKEFSLASGSSLGNVVMPQIFQPANVQLNRGLESLAYGPGGLWTANEEALLPDGPLASDSLGSWVRIQRFDESLTSAGQWGYLTDSISAMNPLINFEQSGVVDILPWTSTQLLVLERELGGAVLPRFRSRIYLVDTGLATDVSGFASLNGGGFVPLAKSLLWEGTFAASNFEGMSLGPTLDDGSRSLLLISDNGGGLEQSLYALRVTAVPEPTGAGVVVAGLLSMLAIARRKR